MSTLKKNLRSATAGRPMNAGMNAEKLARIINNFAMLQNVLNYFKRSAVHWKCFQVHANEKPRDHFLCFA
jgi:hypothetical protein